MLLVTTIIGQKHRFLFAQTRIRHRIGQFEFVTFRLADAVPDSGSQDGPEPQDRPGDARTSRNTETSQNPNAMRSPPKHSSPEEIARRSEVALKLGSCALRRPEIARVVRGSMLHFAGERYHLHAWCIMANHVHVVLTALPGNGLKTILHSWKSYTANQANRLLGTRGAFWERESFDHTIRLPEDVDRFIRYTEENPVAAGLCAHAEDWCWSSCSSRPPP
jgi:REP element-mobilizing transposase RayT